MDRMGHGRSTAHAAFWQKTRHFRLTAPRAVVLAWIATLALCAVVGLRLLDSSRSSSGDGFNPPTRQVTQDATAGGGDTPGLGVPGVHVQVDPQPNGDLEVVERVRFLGAATGLDLSLPAVDGVVRTALPLGMRISGLQASADGARVEQSSDSLSYGGRLLLPSAPLAVELRYRLTGATTRSTPSTPGRAIVLLPPITADERLRGLPVVVEVTGTGVHNLLCPGLPAANQLCGRQSSGGWRTVPLGSRTTAVLAQLDLPST
jgi:hypothetical protein